MELWRLGAYLVGVLLLLGIMLGVPRLLGERHREPQTATPYEGGVAVTGDARVRLSAHYYLVAMLFVIFDVETVFMFPWAVIFNKLLLFGLIEMLVFIFILVVGYYYAWQKGALEWV